MLPAIYILVFWQPWRAASLCPFGGLNQFPSVEALVKNGKNRTLQAIEFESGIGHQWHLWKWASYCASEVVLYVNTDWILNVVLLMFVLLTCLLTMLSSFDQLFFFPPTSRWGCFSFMDFWNLLLSIRSITSCLHLNFAENSGARLEIWSSCVCSPM